MMTQQIRAIILSLGLQIGLCLHAAMAFGAATQPDAGDIAACRTAAAEVELAEGLPTGLLLAIGRQESGRWDPASSQLQPWPFATNAVGVSHFFQSRTEAMLYVALQQRAGIDSIDVGCFQINLRHHPNAFPTLQDAFDPVANAHYAGRFLASLRAETGSWQAAIGRYHSATLPLAESYKAAVLNLWNQPAGLPKTRSEPFRGTVASVVVQRPGECGGSAAFGQARAGFPHVITPTVAAACGSIRY